VSAVTGLDSLGRLKPLEPAGRVLDSSRCLSRVPALFPTTERRSANEGRRESGDAKLENASTTDYADIAGKTY
jgi:hypothetical protein